MRPCRLQVWFLLALLALPARAFAQSSAEHPFRKWDTAGGFGVRFGETDAVDWVAQFGRSWTSHMKTSVLLSRADDPSLEFVFFPHGYQWTQTLVRPIVLSGMFTYQFRENVFIHPYLSAGVRMSWLQDTTETYQDPIPPSATVPCGPNGTSSCTIVYPSVRIASETSPTRLDARPVFGGGAKVYFASGRVFMQPELLVFVDPHGTARGMVRVLVGADF